MWLLPVLTITDWLPLLLPVYAAASERCAASLPLSDCSTYVSTCKWRQTCHSR